MLLPVLEEARRRGFLGPGPLEPHVVHAAGFAAVLQDHVADLVRAADLGSGGGLPGLPLALHLTQCRWTLVESMARRAAFLREAVVRLGLDDRVMVAEDRAEVVGRDPGHRSGYDLVVARSFGPPSVLAECAAPLLRAGGRAVVSEPPGGLGARWPIDGLAVLGMVPEDALSAFGASYQVLRQDRLCSDRYPRRVGVPAKRPLFATQP